MSGSVHVTLIHGNRKVLNYQEQPVWPLRMIGDVSRLKFHQVQVNLCLHLKCLSGEEIVEKIARKNLLSCLKEHQFLTSVLLNNLTGDSSLP